MLLIALLVSCAPKPVHIAQLESGMTRAEVEAVQGKPVKVQTSGDYTALAYHPDFHVILERGRVIAFGRGRLAKYAGSDRFLIIESSP